jgi:excisionase family DNA binding protein
MQQERLTVAPAEAAQMIGIGITRLYELIGSGQIESCKLGRRRLVKVASLRKLVDAA